MHIKSRWNFAFKGEYMKRNLRKEISAIEIEEILAEHFNAFDVLLKIVDTEDGQMVYAEIVDYK